MEYKKMFSDYTSKELIDTINKCNSIKKITEELNLHASYSKYIKAFIDTNNIDISHFEKNSGSISRKIPIQDRLVKNGKNVKSDTIKNYIVKNNIVENKCSICNLEPMWNGKKLTLQLDHINGDHYDNRVENLRLICPNCHTQTDTFTGKSLRKYAIKNCSTCNTILKKDNTTMKCIKCITDEKHLCIICKKESRHSNKSRCNGCLKIEVEKKYCIYCKEEIHNTTNYEGYHKKCYKNNKIVKMNK
jgi:hypothetical protein